MKVFTLILASVLYLSSLSAKPVLPTFSGPNDSLLIEEFSALALGHLPDSSTLKSTTAGESEALIPQLLTVPDVCGQGVGSIDLVPDPGIFFYSWSNGETLEDISGLTAGTYSVTITDNGGVTQVHMAMVGAGPNIIPTTTAAITPNTLCGGPSNGAIAPRR